MTTTDSGEASHRIRRETRSISAQKHRDAPVLDGQLHRDAFSPPPTKSTNPFSINRPYSNTFTPTPGAGKYQRKAEKLLWDLENKLRGSKLSASEPGSSGLAEEGRFGGVVFDADSRFNTIDGGLYASSNEMLVMSGALSADDSRCELGKACFRNKIGRHDRHDESSSVDEFRTPRDPERKRGKRREQSDFRSLDSGWYAPHEESGGAGKKERRRRKKRGERL
ncbi:hypothetical protein HII31_08786 [Pseudocercospora fuligena]|uniref:Uncharacterized protein n=1 Tax=Pseudocercospora fuligena TaxID=685502 RepID=A0A8H6RFF4_9PEZI|nr:hypothetical protein HII31_08786 [Pseudocercospora fuligena]